jgi:hypothetical protein
MARNKRNCFKNFMCEMFINHFADNIISKQQSNLKITLKYNFLEIAKTVRASYRCSGRIVTRVIIIMKIRVSKSNFTA